MRIAVSNRGKVDEQSCWIMARPPEYARVNGHLEIEALTPAEPLHPLIWKLIAARRAGKPTDQALLKLYREGYKRQLYRAGQAGLLAPGRLMARPIGGGAPVVVGENAVVLCACSREHAAAGECHRVWAGDALVYYGWEVVRDYGPQCACLSLDEYDCVRFRYGYSILANIEEPCTCACHGGQE